MGARACSPAPIAHRILGAYLGHSGWESTDGETSISFANTL
jgi:hypothetical protein